MPIPHYKDRLHRDFILQSYVETPTKYNTSLRVLTASSGDILCSSLKYSEPGKGFLNKKDTCFDLLLANPKSPYFIGSENVFSNTVAGGNSILLGNYKSYSEEEKNIMFAHYIDPWNAVVPKDVIDTSLKIAMACRRELGSICGMDFIFDNKTKTWKYLELHKFPMLSSYAELYNYSYPSPKTDYNKFLSAHRFIDLKARLAALSLMMMRK